MVWTPRWNEDWFNQWLPSSPKGVVLFGARQTGKSSLIKKIRQFAGDSLLYNYASTKTLNDHRISLEPCRGEILAALEGRKHGNIPLTVFVDEAPRNAAMFDLAQELMDIHKGELRFVLTGSSARQLLDGSANRLPGRVFQREMWPLALGELGGAANAKDAMVFGLLPEITHMGMGREELLASYSGIYVREEIEQENLVKSPEIFSRFLPLASAEAGGLLNHAKLARQLGIAPQTVKRFYEILVSTKVAFYLTPFTNGHDRKEVIQTPKFYWFDNGVRNALASRPLQASLLNLEGGLLFEHLLVQEAAKTIAALSSPKNPIRMHYWRSHNGREVDLVLQSGVGKTALFEFKFTATPDVASIKGIPLFLESNKTLKAKSFIVAPLPRDQTIGNLRCLTVESYVRTLKEFVTA